jgi:hypothetical protein
MTDDEEHIFEVDPLRNKFKGDNSKNIISRVINLVT